MKQCIICNNRLFSHLYNNTLLKCNNCNFITANLTIDKEELRKIYSANYFKGEEYLDYVADKNTIQINFHKRINQIDAYKNDFSSALEIGCAYGFFAEVFSNKYPFVKYVGIDIVDEAINYGRTVLHQNLYQIDYLNFQSVEKYSHIFMWDVIEHLPEPEKFIEKIANEIHSGGHLFITTGDISRLLPRLQKSKWRMIHPPSHLHYFSKKTLSMLLLKYGFEIDKVHYPSVYRSVKQIFFSLFMLNKKQNRFKNIIYKLIPNKLFIPINTYDIMFVIARKS